MTEPAIESAASPSTPTVELLSWLSIRPRTYAETIEAWHSHCPRLTVWEDALGERLIRIERGRAGSSTVALTERGRATLARAERSR
jgi:hypothetical protein